MDYPHTSCQSRNTINNVAGFSITLFLLLLLAAPTVKAVEVLSALELGSHCALLADNPEGVDGQYCIRYIQGFIDGAIATDARVMLNAERNQNQKESFTERAIRTRMPSPADRTRAANLAGFCLGDPLPLRDVVDVVVKDLNALTDTDEQAMPAMEVVYASLKRHYPCSP